MRLKTTSVLHTMSAVLK